MLGLPALRMVSILVFPPGLAKLLLGLVCVFSSSRWHALARRPLSLSPSGTKSISVPRGRFRDVPEKHSISLSTAAVLISGLSFLNLVKSKVFPHARHWMSSVSAWIYPSRSWSICTLRGSSGPQSRLASQRVLQRR